MAVRKILVTSALPYANGSIHIGHMVEYIQTDIWVRFQRMKGNICHFVCADDAHGTPIMLRSQHENIDPQELINKMSTAHQRDFSGFHINFDNYHSTHSKENKEFVEKIYQLAIDKGSIELKTIKQAYDSEVQTFLPDRFIKGSCPRCAAAGQYGDNCESCGATYDTTELINPISTLTGGVPVEKETDHYFFKVNDFKKDLSQFLSGGAVQKEISNKLKEWFEEDLKSWDITRDAPYWGFRIPNTEDKYFYVWLDAPIGYLSSFKNLCDKEGISFEEYWNKDSTAEVYHFIGKDIAYFHTLFWPALLTVANYRLPTGIFCHGFLTVDGSKMSKSRGTFIQADCYLRHLPPEALRYYFAAKLNGSIEDIDLNLHDFIQRVNSDLVGKIVNIASRCSGFINKKFNNSLSSVIHDQDLLDKFINSSDLVVDLYERRRYSQAMREIMLLADAANQYIDKNKPWVLIKDDEKKDEVHDICSQGINLYRILIIYLKPVLPQLAEASETFLNDQDLSWNSVVNPLYHHTINKFQPLMKRVDNKNVERMLADNKSFIGDKKSKESSKVVVDTITNFIDVEDVTKIDLRIVRIDRAVPVEGADKLLQLTLDLGHEKRTVFAGIKPSYSPEQLDGILTVMVANLAPRKTRFGISEGMILTASSSDSGLYLLSPDSGALPGMKIL